MSRPAPAFRVEAWLVALVAAHSYGVGAALLLATRWGVAFGGWEHLDPLFFARQAGVFHLVVATGYLLEYFLYRRVTLLLTAKGISVVFLAAMMLVDTVPWAVPVSALGDGLMGLAVLACRRWTGAVGRASA